MGYRKTVYTAGDYKIIKKTHTKRMRSGGRSKKESETREAVRLENQRLRVERLQMLIMANFRPGDLYMDLTYRKDARPETIEEAKAIFAQFIRKVRRRAKRNGEDIHWIVTTERGERGACHHHLIINYSPCIQQAVTETWDRGHVHFQHLYDAGDGFRQLAAYMAKQDQQEKEKAEIKNAAAVSTGTVYSRSRNLVMPKEKEEIVDCEGTWRKEPKAERGYVILPGTVENRTNPVTGYPVQRYIMQKIRTEGRRHETPGSGGGSGSNRVVGMGGNRAGKRRRGGGTEKRKR